MSVRLIKPDIPAIARAFKALRPAGGFAVICADCPWLFANFSEKGEEKNAVAHYRCMETEDIARLPVELLAAKDCVLFMWCTWPMLESWAVIYRAWGFEYAGLAWEWIKFNPETGNYAFGPGYGTRKNLEPCIICTRGSPRLRGEISFFGQTVEAKSRSVRDFIEVWPLDTIRQPRREHSRKPEEARRRIETMFDGPYIELFARAAAEGWSAWGDELGKFEAAA